jgi:hypothetical protein
MKFLKSHRGVEMLKFEDFLCNLNTEKKSLNNSDVLRGVVMVRFF